MHYWKKSLNKLLTDLWKLSSRKAFISIMAFIFKSSAITEGRHDSSWILIVMREATLFSRSFKISIGSIPFGLAMGAKRFCFCCIDIMTYNYQGKTKLSLESYMTTYMERCSNTGHITSYNLISNKYIEP